MRAVLRISVALVGSLILGAIVTIAISWGLAIYVELRPAPLPSAASLPLSIATLTPVSSSVSAREDAEFILDEIAGEAALPSPSNVVTALREEIGDVWAHEVERAPGVQVTFWGFRPQMPLPAKRYLWRNVGVWRHTLDSTELTTGWPFLSMTQRLMPELMRTGQFFLSDAKPFEKTSKPTEIQGLLYKGVAVPLRPVVRGFVLDTLIFGGAIFLLVPLRRWMSRRRLAMERRCHRCRHQLLEAATACPECGTARTRVFGMRGSRGVTGAIGPLGDLLLVRSTGRLARGVRATLAPRGLLLAAALAAILLVVSTLLCALLISPERGLLRLQSPRGYNGLVTVTRTDMQVQIESGWTIAVDEGPGATVVRQRLLAPVYTLGTQPVDDLVGAIIPRWCALATPERRTRLIPADITRVVEIGWGYPWPAARAAWTQAGAGPCVTEYGVQLGATRSRLAVGSDASGDIPPLTLPIDPLWRGTLADAAFWSLPAIVLVAIWFSVRPPTGRSGREPRSP